MPTLARLIEMQKDANVAIADTKIVAGYFLTMTAISLINRDLHSEALHTVWNIGMVAFGVSILRYLVTTSKTDGYLEELKNKD